MQADILKELQEIVGSDFCLTQTDDLQTYGKDWSKLYQVSPCLIVRPSNADEVQKIILLANHHSIAIVPSGGRTGLSGGACATQGEIVLSLDRMNQIIDFNEVDQTVKCEAGVITEQLQQFAEDKHLFYPVDFASSGSSQIGGNIATNAGGINVIRWGMTREWVCGLKVVTGKGELLEFNHGLIKNATGYDFRHLFIGSEGTLGVIVEATIKLTQQPKDRTVIVLGLNTLSDVYPVMTEFQSKLSLTAFEFFSHKAMEYVLQHRDVKQPFETQCEFYVLIEFENDNEETLEKAFACFESAMENGHILDGVISQSETQAKELWVLREGISESISVKTPYKNDISVMPSQVSEFLDRVDAIVRNKYPNFEIIWFGHIGDGNLHLNILRPDDLSIDDFVSNCEQVNPLIFEEIKRMKGSISAEHGVGLLKKKYLQYSRSPEEVEYMKQIKQLFDPNKIINPGKLID